MTPKGMAGLLVAVGVVFALWRWEERRIGARDERLRVADSVAVVRTHEQAAAHDSAVSARATADSLTRAAQHEQAQDAKREAIHDRTITATADARAQAERLLLDSAAVLDSVRARLADLVASSRADSVASAGEREQHQRTVLALGVALASDSTALQRGVAAENAALARAVAAEQQVRILRADRPSLVGNVLRGAFYVGAGWLARGATR